MFRHVYCFYGLGEMKSRPCNPLKSVMQTVFGWSLALKERPSMQSEHTVASQLFFLKSVCKRTCLNTVAFFAVLPSILLLIPAKQQAFWNLLSKVCSWMAAGYALIPFSCSGFFFVSSVLFCNLKGRVARSRYNSNNLCITGAGVQGGLDTPYKKTGFMKLLAYVICRWSKQS